MANPVLSANRLGDGRPFDNRVRRAIFRDPVRVPDHNACYPRIARHPRATARAFTSLFGYHTRRKSVLPAVLFQLPGPSLVTESRRRLLVRSLLRELNPGLGVLQCRHLHV